MRKRKARGIIYLPVDSLRPSGPKRDHGDLDTLKASIWAHSLLQPIIVAPDRKTVIAGRRRLAACSELDWDEVPCWIQGDGTKADQFVIAIAENLERKPLTDMETVSWIAQYDELMRREHGERRQGGRPSKTGHTVSGSWSLEKTAQTLGISKGAVSKAVRIAAILRRYPDLARLNGHAVMREAERRDAARRAPKRATQRDAKFLLADATKVIPSLPKESVQLLLTDPPYGIDYKSSSKDPQLSGGIAGDDGQAGELLKEVLRLMQPKYARDAHCYIFTKLGPSYDLLRPVIDEFFTIHSHIVWVKGKSGPGSEWFAPTTEIIAFGTRGDKPRKLFGTRLPDSVVRNRLSQSQRIHPTEKPLKVLVPLIGKSTVPGELVADPFAGSGSTLVAAKQTGRDYWGCEKAKRFYAPALRRLNQTKVIDEHLHNFTYAFDLPPGVRFEDGMSFDESLELFSFDHDFFYELEPEEFETLQKKARALAA